MIPEDSDGKGQPHQNELYLRSPISQASQLSESIAWGTLNRRGTRDGTQSVSRSISDEVYRA